MENEYKTINDYFEGRGTNTEFIQLGKQASKICREKGLEIKKVDDERYEKINSYPVEVLEQLTAPVAKPITEYFINMRIQKDSEIKFLCRFKRFLEFETEEKSAVVGNLQSISYYNREDDTIQFVIVFEYKGIKYTLGTKSSSVGLELLTQLYYHDTFNGNIMGKMFKAQLLKDSNGWAKIYVWIDNATFGQTFFNKNTKIIKKSEEEICKWIDKINETDETILV